MFKNKYFFLIFVILIYTINSQVENLSDELFNKHFRVIKYSTRELTQLRNRSNKGFHTLTFTADSLHISGICNSCNFKIERFVENSINFSRGGCTRMFCEGVMSLENDLTDVIENANRIRLLGNYLTIYAESKEIIAQSI